MCAHQMQRGFPVFDGIVDFPELGLSTGRHQQAGDQCGGYQTTKKSQIFFM
ncbi:hypothetical protein ACFS07_05230 [Undibacterium arcticum]